jgi:hypothetical protein
MQNLSKEIAALHRLPMNELKARYTEAFGEPTNSKNRAWLVKRVAWRLQAIAEGGLSERARQRAAELANDTDLRMTPPRGMADTDGASERTAIKAVRFEQDSRLPTPGTIITRDYKGQKLQVQVLRDGFEYEGKVYRSLSAVAKAITGSHCNGFWFFRGALGQAGGER